MFWRLAAVLLSGPFVVCCLFVCVLASGCYSVIDLWLQHWVDDNSRRVYDNSRRVYDNSRRSVY